MGDKHHRHVEFLAQIGEQLKNLGLHGYVERGGWFVCEEQFWIARNSNCNHDALTHTARKLIWELAQHLLWLRNANESKQLDAAGSCLLAAHAKANTQAFLQL